MDDGRRRRGTHQAGRVVILAVAAVGCDVFTAVTTCAWWRAFVAAPSNASFAPEDDLGYTVAGVVYAASSLLRYAVLAVLLVLVLRCRAFATRVRASIAAALVLIEVGYVAAAWTSSNPTGGWCVLRLATCLGSALVSGVVITAVSTRRTRRRSGPLDLLATTTLDGRENGWRPGS